MRPALLVLALAGTAIGAGDDFIKLQRKAEQRREPAERLEWFARAIKAWNSAHGSALLAHCHLRRGEAYTELKEDAKALSDLDRAIELDARSALAYFLRGRIQLRRGKALEAARDLAEYAALEPEDIEGHLTLGEARRAAKQWDQAMSAYNAAAQLEPGDYRPVFGRGLALMGMRSWPGAELSFDLAVRLSKSREPEVLIERAVVRVALKRSEEAVEDYSAALPLLEERLEEGETKLRPKAARAYYGRGRLTASMPDYEAACRLGHKKACSLLPKQPAVARDASQRSVAPEPPKAKKKKLEKQPKPVPYRRTIIEAPDSDPGERIYAQ